MSIKQSQAVRLDESTLVDYAGVYYSPELQAVYEIRADGKLVTAHLRGLQGSLTPGPADFFTLAGLSLRFTRDDNRRVNGFRLWEIRARGVEFIRSNL